MTARADRGRIGAIELAVLAIFVIAGTAIWFFFVRETKRPNVILISIDTLRADHVSCYGYESTSRQKTTPNLDALAARGVRFRNAHSSTSWTLPAHLALMTGLPDQIHGVRFDQIPLDSHRMMLAKRMTRAGYRSVGFFGGPYLDPFFGFGDGFSSYENCGTQTAYAEGAGNDQAALNKMDYESHRVVTAKRITDKAIEFLASRKGDEPPFFLFLHHWDCHYDYNAPPQWRKKFAPDYQGTPSMTDFYSNSEIHSGMDPVALQHVIDNYDAEIGWVDDNIGRLLQKLEELQLAEDTLIVVTADHGEEFFEHGQKGHRFGLNVETLHIPLIVAGPGVRRNVAIDETVRIFDVAPTLLELLDLEIDKECFGSSLLPFLAGGRVPDLLRDLPIIAELTEFEREPDPNDPTKPLPPDHYFQHEAWSGHGHKLLELRKRPYDLLKPLDLDQPPIEEFEEGLYTLNDPRDPLEQRDLAAERPDLRDTLIGEGIVLRKNLKAWREGLPSDSNPNPNAMPPELMEQLRGPGYLVGDKKVPLPDRSNKKPRKKKAPDGEEKAKPADDAEHDR